MVPVILLGRWNILHDFLPGSSNLGRYDFWLSTIRVICRCHARCLSHQMPCKMLCQMQCRMTSDQTADDNSNGHPHIASYNCHITALFGHITTLFQVLYIWSKRSACASGANIVAFIKGGIFFSFFPPLSGVYYSPIIESRLNLTGCGAVVSFESAGSGTCYRFRHSTIDSGNPLQNCHSPTQPQLKLG